MIRRGYLRKILFVATLVAIAMVRRRPRTFILGSAVFVLGAVLHLWTKGYLVRDEEVTACGPYRFVRHPFYLASALVDLGICIIANSLWIYIVYPILFAMAYGRTIRREEKYMAELNGEAWQAYRKRVPMLLPYRWPAPAPPGRGFRWRNLVQEVELPRFLRLLAYPLIFHVWQELFKLGGVDWNRIAVRLWTSIQEIGVLTVIELAAVIVLFAAAAILRKRLPAEPQSARLARIEARLGARDDK